MGDDTTRLVAGAMTGTSMDGIDVALARIDGVGLGMRVSLVGHRSASLGGLAAALRRAMECPRDEHAALARAFGELHADAFVSLLDGARPDFVSAHGQTIAHRPPYSRQLLDPMPIAARLSCPVVFDFRQADLAAGGQGAPITPIADWILFRHAQRRRLIVNLGGFCNVTSLPPAHDPVGVDGIRAGDVCACNHLLDGVARAALGQPYDVDGAAAARGRPDPAHVEHLDELLETQRRASRSLGSGDELTAWVTDRTHTIAPDDLAATTTEAIARVIARSAPADTDEMVVAGGGSRHRTLLRAVRHHTRCSVETTEIAGVAPEAREALAMAVLGALSQDGVPITLAQVTGCRVPAPCGGRWVGG